MDIKRQQQYNQGISRYKLLSANAGVGTIITSDIGNYILISDVNSWEFIKAANSRINDIISDITNAPEDHYRMAKKQLNNDLGLELIDDERFIQFLKADKGLDNLLCLAAIPHLSLTERYNTIDAKGHPAIKRLKERRIPTKEGEEFTIPGTHFPKWFRNENGLLKTYKEWRQDWEKAGKSLYFFAPPRDVTDPYPNRTIKMDKAGNTMPEYKELNQLNLILICENGHLSDIPWSHYLRWRAEGKLKKKDTDGAEHRDKGAADLFTHIDPCCNAPKLKWTESKNRSEGYASIFIECLNCGLGSGKDGKMKVSLEGINNLEPVCPGHKPWEIDLEDTNDRIPYDMDCCTRAGSRTRMKVALVTGNNIYFANTFSSVYMPSELVKGVPEEMQRVLKLCNLRYASSTDPNKTRKDWAARKIDADLLDENRVIVDNRDVFISKLKELFINGDQTDVMDDGTEDLHEHYRWQEYKVLTENDHSDKKGLIFTPTELHEALVPFFQNIKRIEELKVTSIQLDFTRVQPNEREKRPDGSIETRPSKNIFSGTAEAVHILPAVENYGEGIFFEFNAEAIEKWMSEHEAALTKRTASLMPIPGGGFNGNSLRQKIKRDGVKFLLIHTFSHLIMRELEFSCGYPTASLKERLYISPKMAGLLIYTAEGSEGSMGGLVWQAQTERMYSLITSALERAKDCSSDPLCWQSDGQGLFNLDLAACFSCALVSETACEERNLGLDRYVLVDEALGFFPFGTISRTV